MPNWFNFTLNVSGEEKDVQEFVQNVKGQEKFETEGREFDFNHFIPQPENIFRGNLGRDEEERCNELGIPNWYTWNIENWDTKWNAHCEYRDFNGNVATYNLCTAWSFPVQVIEKMIEMYPNLDFEIEGEEESQSYGVYIDSSREVWLQEDPDIIDEENGKEVYWDGLLCKWRYLDDDLVVDDSEDFYPQTRYSWS